MGSLISDSQSAFLKGRNISDAFVTVRELFGWGSKQEMEGVGIKVDFEKAYDREMDQLGRIVLLVNGVPTNWIKMKRGLRQGDPLSPLLEQVSANTRMQTRYLTYQVFGRLGEESSAGSKAELMDGKRSYCGISFGEVVSVRLERSVCRSREEGVEQVNTCVVLPKEKTVEGGRSFRPSSFWGEGHRDTKGKDLHLQNRTRNGQRVLAEVYPQDLGADVHRMWDLWKGRRGSDNDLTGIIACWWVIWETRNGVIFCEGARADPIRVVLICRSVDL
ncbi:hypothetical protein ACMD2_08678 [Ananas comosus]|uniref:Reverse transcriptase domain-containing protein n=1 Tax=Ananas comosus TaxID=4615 RepID=A0A199VBQ1_ANACO|nr:hypothetical protein ACMD2_08678 [Ananas comosus]